MTPSGNSSDNVATISGELNWLARRIENLLGKNVAEFLPLPPLKVGTSYEKLVTDHSLTEPDRVLLNLAFAGLFQPSILVPFVIAFKDPEMSFRFGGFLKEETGRFYPTVRTALYLLAGDDEELWNYYLCLFTSKHKLFSSNLIQVKPTEHSTNFIDHEIVFNDQFIGTILHGESPRLDGDASFPARRSKRSHTMKEVVLDEKTIGELEKLRRFARNMSQLWSLPNGWKYRQNYISIFSGEPGTGKSHTAEAIGNEMSLPVYKVNFAQLVSKYIGETEKNLERVFDRFSGHPSILFFDEAESIFSKRIEVKDSHDKHANNEQSFLLQKIEEYNGIVILATNVQNLSQYFDKAFQRRIRQIVNFQFSDYPERIKLWENAIGAPFNYEEGLVDRLAKNYQFSGGSIFNVISEGVIEALDKKTETFTFELLEPAMMDEFKKTGRKYEVCTDEMVSQNPVRRYGVGFEQRKNF